MGLGFSFNVYNLVTWQVANFANLAEPPLPICKKNFLKNQMRECLMWMLPTHFKAPQKGLLVLVGTTSLMPTESWELSIQYFQQKLYNLGVIIPIK